MSEQVHIRVGEGRKDKWDTHATEKHGDKYGNISKLIRHAVERQIEADSEDTQSASDGTQTVEANGRVDAILTGVEDNSEALEAIQQQLTNMHDAVVSGGGVSDQTFSDVFGSLPTVTHADDFDSDYRYVDRGKTPSEISEEAAVSTEEAEIALAQMRREYDGVQMHMGRDDTEPTYWREVEQ